MFRNKLEPKSIQATKNSLRSSYFLEKLESFLFEVDDLRFETCSLFGSRHPEKLPNGDAALLADDNSPVVVDLNIEIDEPLPGTRRASNASPRKCQRRVREFHYWLGRFGGALPVPAMSPGAPG